MGRAAASDPLLQYSLTPFSPVSPCARLRSLPASPVMPANRKLGCLSIFLFVALCASLFVNLILAATAFRRLAGSARFEEPTPSFREVIVQRGARGTSDKIAVIPLRGLISSSLDGNVGDSMVDDMRLALQQARDDEDVRAVVLEIDSPGGELTSMDRIIKAILASDVPVTTTRLCMTRVLPSICSGLSSICRISLAVCKPCSALWRIFDLLAE